MHTYSYRDNNHLYGLTSQSDAFLKSSTFGLIRFNRHALCLIAFNGPKVKQSNDTDDRNFPCSMISAKYGTIFFSFRLIQNRRDLNKGGHLSYTIPVSLCSINKSVRSNIVSAFLCNEQRININYHFNYRSYKTKNCLKKKK